jgi:hypothetical protein
MRQFVESMKRLYQNGMVSKEKVVQLYESGKIAENEKAYILEVN